MSNPIRRVTFITDYKFTPRDANRFGLNEALAAGLEAQAIDLSPLLNPSYEQAAAEAKDLAYSVIKPASPSEASQHLASLSDSDFVLVRPRLSANTTWLYRALSKTKAQLCTFNLGPLPLDRIRSEFGGQSGLAKQAKAWLRDAKDSGSAAFNRIRPVDYFLAADDFTQPIGPFSKANKVLRIHSWDYDSCLTRNKNLDGCGESEPYLLFLDSNLAYHDDFEHNYGTPLIRPAEYFAPMRDAFKRIEDHSGIKVKIAVHPRANYDDPSQQFGDYEFIDGSSVNAVAGAKGVLLHYSTAVNFAVTFDKPLCFSYSKLFERIPTIARAESDLAKFFNCELVHFDDARQKINSQHLHHDPARYEQFMKMAVRSSQSKDLPLWPDLWQRIRQ